MTRPALATTPLADIVRSDIRAGAVLDRYHLDYCCGGAMTLAEGCQQRGVDVDRVLADLDALNPAQSDAPADDPIALMAHIMSRHHGYVRDSLPRIQHHLSKVVAAHAERHPELAAVEAEFSAIAGELTQHLVKEEVVLFPYIASLCETVDRHSPPPPDMFGTIQNPIRMMETEHQEAGDRMSTIRQLTHDYAVPADACHTYRLVLAELDAFEQDLVRHVELENNVLFPKAVALEEKAELMTRGLKSHEWDRQLSDR